MPLVGAIFTAYREPIGQAFCILVGLYVAYELARMRGSRGLPWIGVGPMITAYVAIQAAVWLSLWGGLVTYAGVLSR